MKVARLYILFWLVSFSEIDWSEVRQHHGLFWFASLSRIVMGGVERHFEGLVEDRTVEDTLRQVRHPSNEGLALQARV